MKFRAGASSKTSVQVGIKLARLLELPEEAFERRVLELEGEVFFQRLIDTKVLTVQTYAGTSFAARNFGGWGLRTAGDGVSAALDGHGDLATILRRVGQERFEECFLRDEGYTDAERAKACRISVEDAARLREMVDRLYVQAEFDDSSSPAAAAPPKTYSAVAGVMVSGGKPSLAFFNRQIWKGRYQIDGDRYSKMVESLPAADARRLEGFLREMGLIDRRKTTLYRVLEALIESQSRFLITGDPDEREPLTQRVLCDRLDIQPSVLNRLIATKSIQLPWGLQAPIKTLLPSRKSLLRDRLHDLIRQDPEASDLDLRKKVERLYGASLSRRSISQYRAELGVANLRSRGRN